MVLGLMTMLMAMVFSYILNKTVMKENGKWTYKKDLEKKSGQMAPFLKDYFMKVKSMVQGFINGLMVALMKETGLII